MLEGIILLFAGVLLAGFMPSYFFFGILLIIAGIVVLATLPKVAADSKQAAENEPVGVIALLGSIGLGLCTLFAVAWSAIGGGYPHEGGFQIAFLLFPLPIGIFALLGLFLSILVIRGVSSRKLWFILMAYWIVLIPFSLSWSFFFGGFIFILIYPVTCILYFLSDRPKQYFHVTAEQP